MEPASTTTAWLLLGVALLLILANGLFVAAEFALVTVDRGVVSRAAATGDHRAQRVSRALRALSFELSGAQLGITITSLLVGMLANPAMATLLAPPLTSLGLPSGAVHGVAVVVGMTIATVVQMVIGELVPKNWAISRPLQVARAAVAPQQVFSTVFRPVILLLNGAANRLVRAMGLEPAEELASARGAEELVALARHSASEGALESDTADLFVRTLGLGELTAESVMTPRVEVSALQDRATAADVVNLTRATGLSRFPVYRDSIDEVTGVVTLKEALAVPVDQRSERRVAELMSAPLLVPETLPVERLLEQLRRRHSMAVVVDEYGGTAGVVTLEDIVEEMVGEVMDEHDIGEHPELRAVEPVDGRPAWEVDGRCRVDQLEAVGFNAPEGPYETIAGLVADLLGRLPAAQDSCALPGWRLTVLTVDRRRTGTVLLVRTGYTLGDAGPGERR